MSFAFLQSVPADVCHVIGGLILVADAGLVTFLAVYWNKVDTPSRPPVRPRDRRPVDKIR